MVLLTSCVYFHRSEARMKRSGFGPRPSPYLRAVDKHRQPLRVAWHQIQVTAVSYCSTLGGMDYLKKKKKYDLFINFV